MFKRTLIMGILAMSLGAPAFADAISDAKMAVAKHAGPKTVWDGPTTGPTAVADKSIVILAGDMKNGGILGVTNGIEEASGIIGWKVKTIDGAGSISKRAAAFGQALALKPDGIFINGFDAKEQKVAIQEATSAGIPLISWHAGPVIGPDAENGIFTNISTNAMDVSAAAAQWAFADAEGKPAVVIFTDSCCDIAIAKADRIKEEIEAMGGTVLEYVDTPIADTSNRMPSLTTALLQRHGAKWTHSLAINDIYFDFMGPSLAAVGIGPNDYPRAVAAGDGSESAYQRIRTGQYQSVTVAEPLNLQGWQMVDEMNRAIQGKPHSAYTAPFHVVTKANISSDGGENNIFDPDNGYRDAYKKIWAK